MIDRMRRAHMPGLPARAASGAERHGSPPRRANRRLGRSLATTAIVALALAAAACGSSKSSSSSSSSGSPGGTASASSSSGNGASVAAARSAIAAYTGHPSAFTVTKPLGKKLPAGTKFVFLQDTAPIAALFNALLKPAVQTIGGSYSVINAGATASSAQAAASSALSEKPAVILIPALVPSEFGDGLQKLKQAGVKVVGTGMINAAPYGVQFNVAGAPFFALSGKLLADWVVANKGAEANAVFYTTPELSFTNVELQAFKQEMNKLCPKCAVRTVPIPLTTYGTSAPQTMANDLQSNPSTNVAVFSSEEMAQGLPSAMSSAGIKVTTVGAYPTPENLQDIKSGGLTAGLASDLGVQAWSMIDAAARLQLGETPLASEQNVPLQFLSQKDITFNTKNGWSGYPDYQQRFAKLWK